MKVINFGSILALLKFPHLGNRRESALALGKSCKYLRQGDFLNVYVANFIGDMCEENVTYCDRGNISP